MCMPTLFDVPPLSHDGCFAFHDATRFRISSLTRALGWSELRMKSASCGPGESDAAR